MTPPKVSKVSSMPLNTRKVDEALGLGEKPSDELRHEFDVVQVYQRRAKRVAPGTA